MCLYCTVSWWRTAKGVALRAWARKCWPHIRAALLLVHLAGILLLALPSSHRLGDRNHWQKPKQQQEISGWADRLGVDKDAFQSFLWDTSQRYLSVRKRLIRPFYVYADYTGSRQGWTMFANPRTKSARFEIAGVADASWPTGEVVAGLSLMGG